MKNIHPKSALVYSDPVLLFKNNMHFNQLLSEFFGPVFSFTEYLSQNITYEITFICGWWQDILINGGNKFKEVILVEPFLYNGKTDGYKTISYRRLALKIPELGNTGDRLVPLDESVNWYDTLYNSQDWYTLLHANHINEPAYRTGTYCSEEGPFENSIWLQRCSTVFKEPTQIFNDTHKELLKAQKQADEMFICDVKNPNVLLIQHYEPTAEIGAHSDKSLDLKTLEFRSFSAYETFCDGNFDREDIELNPCDYRIWGWFDKKNIFHPVIRFMTLKNKQTKKEINIPLPPNWMFIMTDKTHREWTHAIKKQVYSLNRISVTARYSDTVAQYEETGKVKIFKSLDPVGYLEFADKDQSNKIDDLYKLQNIEKEELPDYSEVMLCTRNPGDLKKPDNL